MLVFIDDEMKAKKAHSLFNVNFGIFYNISSDPLAPKLLLLVINSKLIKNGSKSP